MQRFMIQRCNPLSTDLWVKPQTNSSHEFILLFSIHSNKQCSNTFRLTQRPDFKQALSTLHPLQREAKGACRNQQWAQSSSSSSWWSWQGSWWTPYFYESHHGDEPSTDRTERPVIQVFRTILQGMIFLNSFTLLQMDRLQLTAVYCNRRVKTTPQKTRFRCENNYKEFTYR